MKHVVVAILVAIHGLFAVGARAESEAFSGAMIRVEGRPESVVTESVVRLGDVAQIESPNVQNDEAIIQLKRIVVGESPKAGEVVVLDGSKVLQKMRDEGVKLDSLRYTLPRQMTVTRAFREVKGDELERVLSAFIAKDGRQIDVKQLVMEKPVRIPTDSMGLEVVALKTTQPGHIGVDYKSIAGSDEVRFHLRAIADEWRLMPVAAKPLTRGTIVTAQDVKLEKLNATALGKDSVENIGDIVGRSVTKDIGQGEMFKTSAIIIPPVITAGSKVTLVFRQGRLEVTATGTALENGAAGAEIKVRNEASQKVVSGRVSEPGLVMVGAQ